MTSLELDRGRAGADDGAPGYDTDFYAWALAQAAALRRLAAEGRDDGVDWPNLVEEVEGLAGFQRDTVRSALKRVVEHLLKLEHSPARDPRGGWEVSVIEHRQRIGDAIGDSPSLRPLLPELQAKAWVHARRLAAQGLARDGVDPATIPGECPYSLEQILDEDWWPANRHGRS